MLRSFFKDKAVLVTGASSGIGAELAWQLAQAGAKLMLTARRKTLLDNLAQRLAGSGKPRPLVAACDVTKDGELEQAVAETIRRWRKLDVMIANAGFAVVGANGLGTKASAAPKRKATRSTPAVTIFCVRRRRS